MALKKPDKDSHKVEYPEAYHRVGKWTFEGLYGAPRIKCTVFTFRSEADVQALDAAIADPENTEKPTQYGPIQQREFSFGLEDFGGKDKLTMAETYKLLKKEDFFADAIDA